MVLKGIGNYQNFNYYIFKKDKKLLETLDGLFKKVFDMYTELSYDEIEDKRTDIFKLKDKHHSDMSNKGAGITIFYGDKEIYLTIICNNSMRLKFNEALGKIAEMPKPKKLREKIVWGNKKRKNGKKK